MSYPKDNNNYHYLNLYRHNPTFFLMITSQLKQEIISILSCSMSWALNGPLAFQKTLLINWRPSLLFPIFYLLWIVITSCHKQIIVEFFSNPNPTKNTIQVSRIPFIRRSWSHRISLTILIIGAKVKAWVFSDRLMWEYTHMHIFMQYIFLQMFNLQNSSEVAPCSTTKSNLVQIYTFTLMTGTSSTRFTLTKCSLMSSLYFSWIESSIFESGFTRKKIGIFSRTRKLLAFKRCCSRITLKYVKTWHKITV